MNPSRRSLTPAQASAALGVSAKALRLYEDHGLLTPDRARNDWVMMDSIRRRGLGASIGHSATVLRGRNVMA